MRLLSSSPFTLVGIGAEERGGGDQKDLLPNSLAAAGTRSWRRLWCGNYCPAAGLFGLGTFWFDDTTSGSRRRITFAALLARMRSRLAQTATADPAGSSDASVTASMASHCGH
jgi:hypothetical protein